MPKPPSETALPFIGWPVNDDWDLLVICGQGVVFQFPAGTTREAAREEIRAALGIERVLPDVPQRKAVTDHITAMLRTRPGTTVTISQILAELAERGWEPARGTKARPYNVIVDTLAVLYNRGVIDRVAPGVYAWPGAEQP